MLQINSDTGFESKHIYDPRFGSNVAPCFGPSDGSDRDNGPTLGSSSKSNPNVGTGQCLYCGSFCFLTKDLGVLVKKKHFILVANTLPLLVIVPVLVTTSLHRHMFKYALTRDPSDGRARSRFKRHKIKLDSVFGASGSPPSRPVVRNRDTGRRLAAQLPRAPRPAPGPAPGREHGASPLATSPLGKRHRRSLGSRSSARPRTPPRVPRLDKRRRFVGEKNCKQSNIDRIQLWGAGRRGCENANPADTLSASASNMTSGHSARRGSVTPSPATVRAARAARATTIPATLSFSYAHTRCLLNSYLTTISSRLKVRTLHIFGVSTTGGAGGAGGASVNRHGFEELHLTADRRLYHARRPRRVRARCGLHFFRLSC
ncbi:hypothetical protein EVAR_68971_1 [Eumeta japonica]|uniref:Uncharacterized protein n=1 Tax=Eumeta variegata TaxID=151549 RepID=A0A4C2A886_EUMVA|nr:hypothetical protein EVAR_68971_1 [Eumeta japonica]